MNRWLISFALAAVSVSAMADTSFVAHQVLVKYQPGARNMVSTYLDGMGARIVSEMPEISVLKVRLPATTSVASSIDYLKRLNGVGYAEPNYIVHADVTTPNDPLYPQQYSAPRMQGNLAWDLTVGDPNVMVAVIDTGCDYTHEDLSGKVVKGHDYVNGDEDPMDDNGHGTHCSGVIGAKSNNAIGGVGMCWNAQIYAVKVLSAGGSGTEADVDAGIIEAANKGVDIISLSLGGGSASSSGQDAVTFAWTKGVVIFAAAGNDGSSTKHYPAAYDNVISVGATDQSTRKPFSPTSEIGSRSPLPESASSALCLETSTERRTGHPWRAPTPQASPR